MSIQPAGLSLATEKLYIALISIAGEDQFGRDAIFIADGDDESDINGLRERQDRVAFFQENKEHFFIWIQEQAARKKISVEDWLYGTDFKRIGTDLTKDQVASIVLSGEPSPQTENIIESVVREFMLHISRLSANHQRLKPDAAVSVD